MAIDTGTGVIATLSSAKVDTSDQLDDIPSNQEVLGIRVVLKNTGRHDQSVNPLDFTAIDDRGRSHEATVYFDQEKLGPGLESGLDSLQPGKTQSGEIAYHILRGTTSVSLTWKDGYNLNPPAKLGTFAITAASVVRTATPFGGSQSARPTAVPLSSSGPLTAVRFDWPSAVAVDSQGNIYVTDYNHNRVVKLMPHSNRFQAWGRPGSGPMAFDGPGGIAVDSQGDIYVADGLNGDNGRVRELSPSGTVLHIWKGSSGTKGRRFSLPQQITFGADRNLYLADMNGFVQKLSAAGTALAVWGSEHQLLSPSGVAVDAHGAVYIVDSEYDRVVKVSAAGRLLAIWNEHTCKPSTLDNRCDGHKPGQFAGPGQAATDARGDVYVADTLNSRVEKFSSVGRLLAIFKMNSMCSRCTPQGIALDRSGDMYVTDGAGTKVFKLSATGKLLARWGR